MGKLVYLALVLFTANSAFATAYRYKIDTSLMLNSTCKHQGETKKTHLKLYIPNNAGKSKSDTVHVKVHACIAGNFMKSTFNLRMPLKAWSESSKGTHSMTIPSSLMASEFGAKGSGQLTVNVVDQDLMKGVPGFKVGTHYPLKSLRIQIPGYGALNAKLQRLQNC